MWRSAGAARQSTAGVPGRGKSDVSAKLSRREDGRRWEYAFCRAARHTETERATTRTNFVLWRVVSCGSRDQGWGRTKLDLGSGKPFDDHHRSTTLGTESKIVRVIEIGGG